MWTDCGTEHGSLANSRRESRRPSAKRSGSVWTPYLSEVQPHLPAAEVRLVQSEPGLCCGQGVAEADPDPPEGPEVLELDLWVEGAKQRLKAGL